MTGHRTKKSREVKTRQNITEKTKPEKTRGDVKHN